MRKMAQTAKKDISDSICFYVIAKGQFRTLHYVYKDHKKLPSDSVKDVI